MGGGIGFDPPRGVRGENDLALMIGDEARGFGERVEQAKARQVAFAQFGDGAALKFAARVFGWVKQCWSALGKQRVEGDEIGGGKKTRADNFARMRLEIREKGEHVGAEESKWVHGE